jgi:signal recognition particle subunit SRP19
MGKKNAVRVKQIGGKQSLGAPLPNFAEAFQPPEEIHLPPSPDRSYQIIWPLTLHPPSIDVHEYHVVYPAYLDATKTLAQGRRIAVNRAVEIPTVMDLSQALQRLQIPHIIQPYKGYSRDASVWDNPGRVMVKKTYTSRATSLSKLQLLVELGEAIKTLPERLARLERQAAEKQQYQQEAQAYHQEEQTKTSAKGPKKSSSSSSQIKRKGKKGRK